MSGTDERAIAGTSRRGFLAATGAATATTLVGIGQVAADPPDPPNSDNPHKKVISYYPYWGSGRYPPSEIPFDKLTALNWAFVRPQEDGSVTLGNSDPEDIQTIEAASDGNTKLMFSISGGWYPEEYSKAARTEENRQRFAETAVDLVLEYGFDGIDLDWEYPTGRTHEDDPENFVKLARAVREELDERVRPTAPLSVAVNPSPGTADSAYLPGLFDHLSWTNVMNYDYAGSWSSVTDFNAPLHSGPDSPLGSDWNVASHLEYWMDRDVDNDKIVMGIPFYGRAFHNVKSSDNDGLYQSFDGSGAETFGKIVNEIEPDSNFEKFRHPDAKVPWLFDGSTFISYDDAESVATKMDFVQDNDLGGAFCWELSQDPTDTLINGMYDKLAAPQTQGRAKDND